MALPKYVQIIQTMRRRISDGTYPAGAPIPSEAALCIEFNVSRPTVVRALGAMQLMGEIERRHGIGSFVSQAARALTPADDELRQLRDFAEFMTQWISHTGGCRIRGGGGCSCGLADAWATWEKMLGRS
jgi:DNA-binding GntR family transcriptional regulator